MARWRLLQPHYLNVPGNEWEYKETNRDTGRQARKVFAVPQFLNPNDAADHNYREDGDIIVSDGNNAQRKDIIFVGPPTPDMEPLDDEAQAISDAERPKWQQPIESLPGQGYSASLLSQFEAQLAALVAGNTAKPASAMSVSGVDPSAFEALQQQVAALMEKNAELEAKVLRRA